MRVLRAFGRDAMGTSSLGSWMSGRTGCIRLHQAASGCIGEDVADPAVLGYFVAELVSATGQKHIREAILVRVSFRDVIHPKGILRCAGCGIRRPFGGYKGIDLACSLLPAPFSFPSYRHPSAALDASGASASVPRPASHPGPSRRWVSIAPSPVARRPSLVARRQTAEIHPAMDMLAKSLRKASSQHEVPEGMRFPEGPS
jgi:hypothetical protein